MTVQVSRCGDCSNVNFPDLAVFFIPNEERLPFGRAWGALRWVGIFVASAFELATRSGRQRHKKGYL